MFIILPSTELEFEMILITIIIITVCKPNGGVFRKPIVKAIEEVSCAEDIGIIGNHYGSFTK